MSACPRCSGPIPDEEHEGLFPGALSRLDNETEICSRCGVEEALFNWFLPGWQLPPLNMRIATISNISNIASVTTWLENL